MKSAFEQLCEDLSLTAISAVNHNLGTNKGLYAHYDGEFPKFCEEVLKVKLSNLQMKVWEAIKLKNVVNVPSGHGSGKSMLSACLVLYWVFCKNGVAVTTAPTARQVVTVLWAEIGRLHARAGLPGRCLQTKLDLSKYAYGFGFTGSANNGSSIQGIHYDTLLAIQDEATGIHPAIDVAFQSLCTGEDNVLLRVGNPTVPYTAFHMACNNEGSVPLNCMLHENVAPLYYLPEGSEYHQLKPEVAEVILDDKGYVKPTREWPEWVHRPRIGGAVSAAYIEKTRRLGESSADWKARVVGEFPVNASYALFFNDLLSSSLKPDAALPAGEKVSLGIDVGAGQDPHAISVWWRNVCLNVVELQTKGDYSDGQRLLQYVLNRFQPYQIAACYIDADGVGHNLVSQFMEAKINSKGIQWAKKPRNKNCLNLKAEHYLNLSQGFQNLKLKEDREEIGVFFKHIPRTLKEELLVLEYIPETQSGKLQIMKKDHVREKIGRSCNMSDAVALGYAASQGGALGWIEAMTSEEGSMDRATLMGALLGG